MDRHICLFSSPHLELHLDSVLWFDSSWRDLMAVFHIDNPNTLSSAIIMETWRRLAKPNMEKDNHREVFENYLLLAGNESCKTIFYHHWNMQPHAVYLLQLISTLNYTDTGKRNHEITILLSLANVSDLVVSYAGDTERRTGKSSKEMAQG